MKTYMIQRNSAGRLSVIATDNAAGPKRNGFVRGELAGEFSIGDTGKGTRSLAAAVMSHFFGADEAAQAEAARKTEGFMHGFLATHTMLPGSRYAISGEVIDSYLSKL